MNPTLKLANNAFSDLYQKRSVKIWQAVCPEGFGALGNIATNGRMDKPYAEADFSQGIFDKPTTSGKMAMYCLPTKYLAPGKIGKAVYKEPSNPQGVEIYSVVPADANGVAAQGMFVARSADAALPTNLWVLRKNAVAMVEE
jgi:hypothetical protein